jgi:hypothetical protein
MKKSVMLAVAAVSLVVSTTGCAQPYYNNGYYNRGYNNNNGWNYAAAALGGAVVGAIVGSALTPSGPPPGVVPVYPAPPVYGGYYQPRACVTQRVPQYDAYGRVVQFIQMCAN